MYSPIIPAVFALATACGGAQPAQPPLSAADHLARAKQCEEGAKEQEQQATESRRNEAQGSPGCTCPDSAVHMPEPVLGGERIHVMRPCFTEPLASEVHAKEASRLLQEAKEHRKAAARLIETEKELCQGIGELELSHDPFFHRDDIVKVEAYRENGSLRGARLWFRKVPGLSSKWMHQALHCHMARSAVMGYSETFLSYSPVALAEVSALVTDDEQGLVVTVRSTREDIAAIVFARAEALLPDVPVSNGSQPNERLESR